MYKKRLPIVSDISGCTRILVGNELEHADGIIKDLFDSMISEFKKSVQISKFMGNTVFEYIENIAYEKPSLMNDFAKKIVHKKFIDHE